MAEKTKKPKNENKENNLVVSVPTRGRTFEGTVIKKFPHRIVLEFERNIYVQKYERFYTKKTRIHARLPAGMQIEVGDYVKVRECRPLSKIIHSIVVEKLRSAENKTAEEKK